jgi:hypothetical protein
VVFTEAELNELRQVFPTGVCDFSKKGVDQRPAVPWLTYKRRAGGRPLGRAPRSRPLPRR